MHRRPVLSPSPPLSEPVPHQALHARRVVVRPEPQGTCCLPKVLFTRIIPHHRRGRLVRLCHLCRRPHRARPMAMPHLQQPHMSIVLHPYPTMLRLRCPKVNILLKHIHSPSTTLNHPVYHTLTTPRQFPILDRSTQSRMALLRLIRSPPTTLRASHRLIPSTAYRQVPRSLRTTRRLTPSTAYHRAPKLLRPSPYHHSRCPSDTRCQHPSRQVSLKASTRLRPRTLSRMQDLKHRPPHQLHRLYPQRCPSRRSRSLQLKIHGRPPSPEA